MIVVSGKYSAFDVDSICLSEQWVIFHSGNDLLPVRCHVITRTYDKLLPVGLLFRLNMLTMMHVSWNKSCLEKLKQVVATQTYIYKHVVLCLKIKVNIKDLWDKLLLLLRQTYQSSIGRSIIGVKSIWHLLCHSMMADAAVAGELYFGDTEVASNRGRHRVFIDCWNRF